MPKCNRLPASRLLISKPALQLLPSLAVKIGLHEAIVLQQLYYWLLMSKHGHDGRYWVYNTLDEWHAQFPFMSLSTLRRALADLEKKWRLIITGNYNHVATDRTKWYTIDYDALDSLEVTPSAESDAPSVQNEQMGSVQNEQMIRSDRADGPSKMSRSNQETTAKTTTQDYKPGDYIESAAINNGDDDSIIRQVFVEYCREFGDEAPARSIGERAIHLWRRSRLPRDEFLALAQQARQRTRLYQGKQSPGVTMAAKAPYFFTIVENEIYERTQQGRRW